MFWFPNNSFSIYGFCHYFLPRKCHLLLMSVAYIQVHFRLNFFHSWSFWKQSYLGSHFLQYRLPKNISRRGQQKTKIVKGRLRLNQIVCLILYIPVNILSVMLGWVFLGWTSTKQGSMCLTQGHNTVQSVRLEPATLWSRVKHSTTKPLHSHIIK